MALLSISEPGQGNIGAPVERKRALGIDLGTTNSLVASVNNNSPYTIPDEQERHLLPSVVHYLIAGEGASSTLLGYDALAHGEDGSGNTITSVKRLLGRGLGDIKYELPYELLASESGGMPLIKTCAGNLSPVAVSADILKELAARGEKELGGKLDGVVITVPAYFDEAQRQATKDAAKLAGLNVLRLLSEPTAAAVAYGLDAKLEGTVIIYDLGGGTFDVSLMRLQKGVFEVLATGGNAALGGDDFDRAIVSWIKQQADFSGAVSSSQLATLTRLARNAKHALTSQNEVLLEFEKWTGHLSRDIFNTLVDGLIDQTIKACRRVLRDAKISKEEITDVVMVGGSTRSPRVQEKVSSFFQRELLIELDPDRVVALGAAIQADVLVGNKYGDDMLLLDVIPLSLGIETMGGLVEKIIPRNTTIPVARAQEFTTFKDGQTIMSLHVLQGERELVTDCRSLAKFELKGIPPMVAGSAKIKVTFQVDADGLMEVQAEEMASGIKSRIVVKPSFGLEDKEVEQMLQASYAGAEVDKNARALREAQIEAVQIVDALEIALLADGSSLLSEAEYRELVAGIEKLNAALETDDKQSIETLAKVLNESSVEFASRRMDVQISKALAGKNLEEIEE